MSKLMLYIHGQGGNAEESQHYKKLFPAYKVAGLAYKHFTPWETGPEIHRAVASQRADYDDIVLVANSIGAFFSMHGDLNGLVQRAYFISPIVDMEKLICDMMTFAGVTEKELQKRKIIPTQAGADLSWEYLCYVRDKPINWQVPTKILYGGKDNLTSYETIKKFAAVHQAELTVMEEGEHWFHTKEQMDFLDKWLKMGMRKR